MADAGAQAAREVIAAADAALADAATVLEKADRRVSRDRRGGRPGGRRSIDRPINAWSTGQLAYHIGMRSEFVLTEIRAGQIKASMFGHEYRIHSDEVRRYLESKGFPVPQWMCESARV